MPFMLTKYQHISCMKITQHNRTEALDSSGIDLSFIN